MKTHVKNIFAVLVIVVSLFVFMGVSYARSSQMNELASQIVVILTSGGLLLWFGKMLLEKSFQQILQVQADKIKLIRQNDLEYKKSQIQYLYGPLYAILKTNSKINDLWRKGSLSEVNLKIKQLFRENNEKANKIIIENAHLIDESPMPDIFSRFASSTRIWSMYCADTDSGELPKNLSEHPDVEWCKEFVEYIFDKYERLSKELNELYNKYGIKVEA